MATISTHNGSTLSQGHNRRDIKYTSKDGHIRENGHIEIWKDEPLREAYERIFSDAQKEYNEKQKRSDRKINDYIPVADCTRGMSRQNALNSAFEQMGYHGTSIKNTPQMAWQRAQNQELERLCKERGIEVEHGTEKKEHLSVREFQDMKDNLKKDLPTKKGLIFKRYSKEDLETLESKAVGAKRIEEQIKMSIADIPQYLKEKDKEMYKDMQNAWGKVRSAQNKAELLQIRLDEAQKEIKSLQAKNERLKQSNRDLLNELYPGEEKKRNREERHHTERNRDDFDLER